MASSGQRESRRAATSSFAPLTAWCSSNTTSEFELSCCCVDLSQPGRRRGTYSDVVSRCDCSTVGARLRTLAGQGTASAVTVVRVASEDRSPRRPRRRRRRTQRSQCVHRSSSCLGCRMDTEAFRADWSSLIKSCSSLVPLTDTDAYRAVCLSTECCVDGLGSTDSAYGHKTATSSSSQSSLTVVFVGSLVRSFEAGHSAQLVVAASPGLIVTPLADLWTLLSCMPNA